MTAMTRGLVAWAWDRKVHDEEAAHILAAASQLQDIVPRLSWIVPREIAPGEFVPEPVSERAILKYGIDRSNRSYDLGLAKTAQLLTPQGDHKLRCSLNLLYFDNPQSDDAIALELDLGGEDSNGVITPQFFREALQRFVTTFRADCAWVSSPADPFDPVEERTPRVGPLTYIRGASNLSLTTASARAFDGGALIETRENLITAEPPPDTTAVLRKLRPNCPEG